MKKLNKLFYTDYYNVVALLPNDYSTDIVRGVIKTLKKNNMSLADGVNNDMYGVVYSELLSIEANIASIEYYLNCWNLGSAENFLDYHSRDIISIIGVRNYADLCIKYVEDRWE